MHGRILTEAVGPGGGDLRLHVGGLQTTFPGVPLSKFKSLAPFNVAQASLHGIADELFWRDLFFCSSFLDLLKQVAGKFYSFGRHGSILLFFGEPGTANGREQTRMTPKKNYIVRGEDEVNMIGHLSRPNLDTGVVRLLSELPPPSSLLPRLPGQA